MLRPRGENPFDYSLCAMTVTVYHREDLTRQVMPGVHFEQTDMETTDTAVTGRQHDFLLVIPYANDIRPGDKILPGIAPEISRWTDAEGYCAGSVKHRSFLGRFCHTEVRG